MQLLAPDILEETAQLSVAVTGTAFGVGFLLWILGWRGHRFWIVMFTTIGAGVLGLYTEPVNGTRSLVAGVLLAVAAGGLALALARIFAFGAGGVASWLLVRQFAPAWQEPLVCFLVGGLVGLFLFRIWTMLLTSSAGTLLMAYSGLSLAHKLGKLNVIDLASNQATILTCACAAVALLGFFLQFVLERRRGRDRRYGDQRTWGFEAGTDPAGTLWHRGRQAPGRAA
jgi:MFS family permease